jgi:hypothetical protein
MSESLSIASTPASTGISVFDSGQFGQMWRISEALAAGSLIPETLKGKTPEETKANCLRVVEQAARWGLSPFAVMDSASVVKGRLMWEGKLIAAAIKTSLNVRLRYAYEGEGECRKVTVSGIIDGIEETITGTVADWKTKREGSPWDNLANRDQMLAYRGARQWARRHAPEVILGIYAPDEFEGEGELRNVTQAANTRTPAKLETPNIPGKREKELESLAPKEEKQPESPPTRSAKERIQKDAKYRCINEKQSQKGKTFWVVGVLILGKHVEFYTFSQTLANSLRDLGENTSIRVSVTLNSDGKTFSLENYEIIEEKGELI